MIDLNIWGPLLDEISPGWRARQDSLSVDADKRAQLLSWAIRDALKSRADTHWHGNINAAGADILEEKMHAVRFCNDVRDRYHRLVKAAHVENIRDKVRDQLSNDRACYD
jgi:hypothetical protein